MARNNGGNTEWHTARYAPKTPKRCRSPMLTLLPIPFGRERAAAHPYALINRSLMNLRHAAARSRGSEPTMILPVDQVTGTAERV